MQLQLVLLPAQFPPICQAECRAPAVYKQRALPSTRNVVRVERTLHPIIFPCNTSFDKMDSWKSIVLGLALLEVTSALNDGVGLKPHMGWSSWVRTNTAP